MFGAPPPQVTPEEHVHYEERARIFHMEYLEDDKRAAWREVGVGRVQVLVHDANGRVRLHATDRRSGATILNHYIAPSSELIPHADGTEAVRSTVAHRRDSLSTVGASVAGGAGHRAWVYRTLDFASGEPKDVQIAIRFKTADLAPEFSDVFTWARQRNILAASDADASMSMSGGEPLDSTDVASEAAATEASAQRDPSGAVGVNVGVNGDADDAVGGGGGRRLSSPRIRVSHAQPQPGSACRLAPSVAAYLEAGPYSGDCLRGIAAVVGPGHVRSGGDVTIDALLDCLGLPRMPTVESAPVARVLVMGGAAGADAAAVARLASRFVGSDSITDPTVDDTTTATTSVTSAVTPAGSGHGGEVTALASSLAALDAAKSHWEAVSASMPGWSHRHVSVGWVASSVSDLPSHPAMFDAALARDLLSHTPSKRATLESLRRTLRPGARVVVAELVLSDETTDPTAPPSDSPSGIISSSDSTGDPTSPLPANITRQSANADRPPPAHHHHHHHHHQTGSLVGADGSDTLQTLVDAEGLYLETASALESLMTAAGFIVDRSATATSAASTASDAAQRAVTAELESMRVHQMSLRRTVGPAVLASLQSRWAAREALLQSGSLQYHVVTAAAGVAHPEATSPSVVAKALEVTSVTTDASLSMPLATPWWSLDRLAFASSGIALGAVAAAAVTLVALRWWHTTDPTLRGALAQGVSDPSSRSLPAPGTPPPSASASSVPSPAASLISSPGEGGGLTQRASYRLLEDLQRLAVAVRDWVWPWPTTTE